MFVGLDDSSGGDVNQSSFSKCYDATHVDPIEFSSSVLSLQGTFLYSKTITGKVKSPSAICDFVLFSVQ